MLKPEIVLHPVKSSNIRALGHDPKTNTLRVEFEPNGNTYDYNPVTEQAYRDMVSAPSIGSYFHANIRVNDRITFKKVK